MAKEDGSWDNPTRQTWENGDYLSASKLRLSSSPTISKRTGAKKGSKRNLARPSCLVAYRGNGDWDDGLRFGLFPFAMVPHPSFVPLIANDCTCVLCNSGREESERGRVIAKGKLRRLEGATPRKEKN